MDPADPDDEDRVIQFIFKVAKDYPDEIYDYSMKIWRLNMRQFDYRKKWEKLLTPKTVFPKIGSYGASSGFPVYGGKL